MLDRDCFRILGLTAGAPLADIKRNYRIKVKELHPDTGSRPDSLAFNRVVEAYRHLSAVDTKRIIDFPIRESRPVRRAEPKAADSDSRRANPSSSIFEIGTLLLNGKTGHLRAFAAMRLGNSGRASAYSFLRKGLYDQDPQVVAASIEAIGKLRVQQSAPELAALFRRSDDRIKLSILEAVERMRDRAGFKPIILQGMQDRHAFVRRRSLQLFKTAQ